MYYVYEWYNVETNEVFYVGKGVNRRYKVKKRNNAFNNYIKDNNCDSRIVKYFEEEKDAFEFEYTYIKELKSNGQCKCNLHCGGAGGSGEFWTDELRKEYSEHNVMKSQKQRNRMSIENPMKNKEICERVNSQKRKAVIIGNKEYKSIKEAVLELQTSADCISYWCKRGINPNGELCRYKKSTQVQYDGKRYNKGSCKPIIYNGTEYESPVDISKKLNISKYKVYRWAKKGFDDYGNSCKYINDTRELKFERKKGENHAIIVNEEHYKSISEAGRKLGVTPQYIGDILRGKINSKKYICKYDNQQPSISLNG